MVNRAVLAVLRSRRHRLLSGRVIGVRYGGRRSGRDIALAVQYARVSGRELIVVPGRAATKTWWRNFEQPHPLEVLVGGEVVAGEAVVLADSAADGEEREAALVSYRAAWPKVRLPADQPVVQVTLADR
jgi:hypothetical protein